MKTNWFGWFCPGAVRTNIEQNDERSAQTGPSVETLRNEPLPRAGERFMNEFCFYYLLPCLYFVLIESQPVKECESSKFGLLSNFGHNSAIYCATKSVRTS